MQWSTVDHLELAVVVICCNTNPLRPNLVDQECSVSTIKLETNDLFSEQSRNQICTTPVPNPLVESGKVRVSNPEICSFFFFWLVQTFKTTNDFTIYLKSKLKARISDYSWNKSLAHIGKK